MRWLSRVTRYFISQQRDVMNNTIFKGRLSLRLTLSRTLYRCPIATPSTPPSILQLSLASAGKCRMELYFFIRRSKLPLPSFLVTGLWFFSAFAAWQISHSFVRPSSFASQVQAFGSVLFRRFSR